MNFENLFHLQKILDERIKKEHNLQQPTISKRILALQVELGELANETRCFKYWSMKPPSPKNVILEEYVDCLHFILSIGLEKNYTDVEICLKPNDADISNQFLNLFIDINDLVICNSKDHYITLFEDFLSLANSLGFKISEIKNAYERKNEINHQRQNEGY